MAITIEKHWDGNERAREARNGRVSVSRGRYVWLVLVDGVVESEHDLRRRARERVAELGPHAAAADEPVPASFGPVNYPVDDRMIAHKVKS